MEDYKIGGKEMREKWKGKEGIYRERRVSPATNAPTKIKKEREARVR